MKSNIDTRSFTFIELMLSAAILSFAAVSFLAAYGSTVVLNQVTVDQVVAVNDAQYILELFRAMEYETVLAYKTSGYTPPALNNLPSETINVSFGAPDDPVEVRVNIGWISRQRQYNVELVSSFTKLG